MNKAMTITADMENGEQAFFKVVPLHGLEQFLSDVEWVSCPEDVVTLANEGCWEIV